MQCSQINRQALYPYWFMNICHTALLQQDQQVWSCVLSSLTKRSLVVGTGFAAGFVYFVFCFWRVCSWYKKHSNPGNLACVRYVSILSVARIQFRPVTVSFQAFSGHMMMMYTLKVRFIILNNLIRDRGFDCHCILNGRVELLVEYTLCRLRSNILYFIPRHHAPSETKGPKKNKD